MHSIALVYLEEIDNEYQVEMVDAEKEGEYFKLSAPPFFAKHLAVGDLVAVENEEGVHYFDELIEKSGNSTVRVLFKNESVVIETLQDLEALGAVVYSLKNTITYVALDIPVEVNYSPIKSFLEEGEQNHQLWDYQEACLGWK